MTRKALKKIAAGAAVAGALGFASIGIGAGQASAGPHDWCWWGWCDVPPPGHLVPSPGHVGQWTGVPPGHWDKPWKW